MGPDSVLTSMKLMHIYINLIAISMYLTITSIKLNFLADIQYKVRTMSLSFVRASPPFFFFFFWCDVRLMNRIRREMCQAWWLHKELCRKLVMNSRKINKGKFRKCKWKCSSGINWIIKFLVIFCHK